MDIIQHLCDLIDDPLSSDQMYAVIPSLHQTCCHYRERLRPVLKQLKAAVLAVRGLEALGLPKTILGQRSLTFGTAQPDRGKCTVCSRSPNMCSRAPNLQLVRGKSIVWSTDDQIRLGPRDKVERQLAALLPTSALSHLEALSMETHGSQDLQHPDERIPDNQFEIVLVTSGAATPACARFMLLTQREERRRQACFHISRVLGSLRRGALPHLRKLDLSGNFLPLASSSQRSGVMALASALANGSMRSLTTLRLSRTGLEDGDLRTLAAALSRGGLASQLRVLSLNENQLADLTPLAECTRLSRLSAALNNIDMAGLARALERGGFGALASVYLTSIEEAEPPPPGGAAEDGEAADAHEALWGDEDTWWDTPGGHAPSPRVGTDAASRLALKTACDARGIACHCAVLSDRVGREP